MKRILFIAVVICLAHLSQAQTWFIQNTTDKTLKVALSYQSNAGFYSIGWYDLSPYAKTKIENAIPALNTIYWYAMEEGGKQLPLQNGYKTKLILMNKQDAYEYQYAEVQSNKKVYEFSKLGKFVQSTPKYESGVFKDKYTVIVE